MLGQDHEEMMCHTQHRRVAKRKKARCHHKVSLTILHLAFGSRQRERRQKEELTQEEKGVTWPASVQVLGDLVPVTVNCWGVESPTAELSESGELPGSKLPVGDESLGSRELPG